MFSVKLISCSKLSNATCHLIGWVPHEEEEGHGLRGGHSETHPLHSRLIRIPILSRARLHQACRAVNNLFPGAVFKISRRFCSVR